MQCGNQYINCQFVLFCQRKGIKIGAKCNSFYHVYLVGKHYIKLLNNLYSVQDNQLAFIKFFRKTKSRKNIAFLFLSNFPLTGEQLMKKNPLNNDKMS